MFVLIKMTYCLYCNVVIPRTHKTRFRSFLLRSVRAFTSAFDL